MKRLVAFALMAGMLGCAPPDIRTTSYSPEQVGRVGRAVEGVIVSVREVDIRGTSSTGGLAGGAIGGAAGANIGGGAEEQLAGAVIGAIAGAVAGAAMEGGATAQKGMEYIVKTSNGSLLTIVQGTDQAFKTGQEVIVLYGARARIIPKR